MEQTSILPFRETVTLDEVEYRFLTSIYLQRSIVITDLDNKLAPGVGCRLDFKLSSTANFY
jgi:hypothetical protein